MLSNNINRTPCGGKDIHCDPHSLRICIQYYTNQTNDMYLLARRDDYSDDGGPTTKPDFPALSSWRNGLAELIDIVNYSRNRAKANVGPAI